MDAETLDQCKENIQPLKQGRRASQLRQALLAQNDTELQEQLLQEREQHELAIMTYEGPDPLEPRYEYVHWIEQCCPKHGKEVTNIISLLEETIMLFKEDERYKQDTRFIDLILKYIETQENPIELYQMVFAQGLGTKCAAFYKSWADQLDMNNDLQRANQIFQLGFSNDAEPKELLEQSHKTFQMSVGRRMMMGQLKTEEKSVSQETAERQRRVLGKIKKGSSNRPSSGLPGKLTLLPLKQSNVGNSSSTFSVYQEDENGLPVVSASKTKLQVNADVAVKENTVKPGPWNQGFKRRPAPPLTPVPSTPSFKVLVDEEEDTPQRAITATPVPPNVLKIRKAEFKQHPEELFKSTNSSSKPHLPVFEAFAGGREFCFEELRWAYISKKAPTPLRNGKYGVIDEATPIKVKGNFVTPCKSSLSPAPILSTTPCFKDLHIGDPFKTPASSRLMYPIIESPLSGELEGNPEVPLKLDDETIIPLSPVGERLPTLLTSKMESNDIASSDDLNIISRPKMPKPVKTAPFTIFTDD